MCEAQEAAEDNGLQDQASALYDLNVLSALAVLSCAVDMASQADTQSLSIEFLIN